MASDRPAQHFDLVIIGGGMVGGLLAAALADADTRMLVLDAGPQPGMPTGEPGVRVSALTEASHWMLRHTGAWDRLPAERLCAYTSMDVWDADGTGRVHFEAASVPAPQLGWILENEALAASLYLTCVERGVDWRCGQRVESLRRGEHGWRITLAGGDTLVAGLLVGADGARSMVRGAAGIGAVPRDSGHLAIVGAVRTERPHGRCARQRFLESGPLALLPLFGDGHQSSLVWSTGPAQAEQLMKMEAADFDHALTQASEGVLGACHLEGPRAVFPIRTLHASQYVGDRVALVGDAAHVVHPLAGQGVNLGLLDAAVLAEELARAFEAGLPLHHESLLRRYQRRRRGHNALMLNAFNGIRMLFAERAPLVRLVRNLGMTGVDRMTPLKQFFAREAMGRGGDLPSIARPPATSPHNAMTSESQS